MLVLSSGLYTFGLRRLRERSDACIRVNLCKSVGDSEIRIKLRVIRGLFFYKDSNKRTRDMKLASIFFTASAHYLRVYLKGSENLRYYQPIIGLFSIYSKIIYRAYRISHLRNAKVLPCRTFAIEIRGGLSPASPNL